VVKAQEKKLPAAHRPAIESVKSKKEAADNKFKELKQTDKNAPPLALGKSRSR
jgi:hypothetical protein